MGDVTYSGNQQFSVKLPLSGTMHLIVSQGTLLTQRPGQRWLTT